MCRLYLLSSKNAPSFTQNKASVDESQKPGLSCPALIHRYINDEWRENFRLIVTLYSKTTTA